MNTDVLTGFIFDEKYWTDHTSNVHYGFCHFDVTSYQPSLYAQLSIELNQTIAHSVEKRQAEFLAGRYLVAEALHKAGVYCDDRFNVLIGEGRSPIWPEGYIGSITHNNNTAMCAVSNAKSTQFLGIDIETALDSATAAQIGSQVHHKDELELLVKSGFSSRDATTLIFSAKESIFKALYPTVGKFFGFEVCTLVNACIHERLLKLELKQHFAQEHSLPVFYQVRYRNLNSSIFTELIVPR